jgi:hypothetical protein
LDHRRIVRCGDRRPQPTLARDGHPTCAGPGRPTRLGASHDRSLRG